MKKYFSENEWEIIVSVLSGEADESAKRRYDELCSNPENSEYLEEIAKIWEQSPEATVFDQYDSESAIGKIKSLQDSINSGSTFLLRRITLKTVLRFAALAILIFGTAFFWVLIRKPQIPLAYNTISVRFGEQTHITLSDGSNIWLNSGSKLTYPTSFNGDIREVKLEGEAYFDVAHDEKKLFVVNTEKVRIKVLGTAFNVKSYPGDDKIETTLVRGKVVIDKNEAGNNEAPIILKPGEKVTFSFPHTTASEKRSVANDVQPSVPVPIKKVAITHVDPVPITSWKERALVFDNTSLEDMAVILERWFGTPVHLTDETLRHFRYKGRFTHNETIFQVLEVIKITTPLDYVFKNHEITIKKLE